MSHKKLIEIHTYSDDEFMEKLADRIAGLLVARVFNSVLALMNRGVQIHYDAM